ncbi:hypothetical protein RHMOL_Rhmol07G0288000 [Rhododendron molle]|uniref:Uncharacterized protein n=1 Tax=Rhododendron molle TaxID=49168 RepID=A0ACC0N629_RHOML|nr:hypothetical protein RHMOL_Rhmol07G0288000 [Rhododendron molle]
MSKILHSRFHKYVSKGLGDVAKQGCLAVVPIRPFVDISEIDGLDLGEQWTVYALTFNLNRPCQDEGPDTARHPSW